MSRSFVSENDVRLLEKVGAGLTMAAPVVLVLCFWVDNTASRPQLFAATFLLVLVGQLLARIRIDF